jgi:hypothetical protein
MTHQGLLGVDLGDLGLGKGLADVFGRGHGRTRAGRGRRRRDGSLLVLLLFAEALENIEVRTLVLVCHPELLTLHRRPPTAGRIVVSYCSSVLSDLWNPDTLGVLDEALPHGLGDFFSCGCNACTRRKRVEFLVDLAGRTVALVFGLGERLKDDFVQGSRDLGAVLGRFWGGLLDHLL